MIQFGMPTLVEIKSLEECASLCHELNLDFIELNMNLPQFQTDSFKIEKFRSIAKKYNVFYTIHLDENLDPCDFNSRIREAYTQTVLQTIEIAKELKIPVLNMHMPEGVYFSLPKGKLFLFSEYEKEYLQNIKAFKDKCEKAIGNFDIKICIENCHDYNRAPFLIKGLDLLLKSPVFALTFDIGHNAKNNSSDERVIMEKSDKLCHMHCHDVLDNKDHLSLGSGELNIKNYIMIAKQHNCRVVLEIKTVDGLKESIKWLDNNVRNN